ncbi:triphosphoribosyl-dephospho-CoA synthase CitG [Rhodoplanes sp. TEM]|uniref:Probable 2-(5''-triphosphoribosyl)-3'-dephosphocoenzyme-A synthase n=1 Tax=Rhodoplanes tepidamans TaxID=200616 RepID=A0ABT5J653_RHOTP|nr:MULTISPECIES: triphosphoribosyl-dephospho-CoA synthase CitG [Rhodoplanes]MDC7785063.1 triphosphoribosyl-dephospho-CoA synthase CitG [Rhodoplanes tepidamans]MDC7982537.1 triphosphoribosyl-dephospho-CoA synthase CitG [Rhodoplanes sp. TEM]MDQ0356552.1 triphosphoribosyl-dephospho-CoA synthase [Rhodoplanes tepidamans]
MPGRLAPSIRPRDAGPLLRGPHSGAAVAPLAAALADLVVDALLREVMLTPKPGLVDRRNTGSHRDMDVATFEASAAALRPGFAGFVTLGAGIAPLPPEAVLECARPVGLACERAMLAATGGVNTHKGSIFAFGLLLTAVGRLWAAGLPVDADAVCDEVARIAAGLVARELRRPGEPRTAGERLFRRHGLTGARGEAESGFATVRYRALPVLERALAEGRDTDTALAAAFLHLLAHNADTNLAARGGIGGLGFARAAAVRLLQAGGVDAADYAARLCALDDAFIARNLSPGGSADLLAVAWTLHRLPFVLRDGPPARTW